MTEPRFTDQVVVVTGAGQGIGRAIAGAFAREGARVVLTARSADLLQEVRTEIETAGGRAVAIPADVTDPAAVQALRDRVQAELGPADVLVANAGVAGPIAPLWEIDFNDWEQSFAVNVHGVFLTCQAFLPAMVQRRGGSVIVMGSMTGKRPLPMRTAYGAAKMALVGLVRSLANDAGPAGIRVNLISPGPVAGDRLKGVIAAQAQARGVSEDVVRGELTRNSPLGRFVETVDIANATTFLASEDARNITGEDMNVSAGIATW